MIASRFLAAVLLPAMVMGHSWIACTDYEGVGSSNWSGNIKSYSKAACSGFPRDFTTYNGGPFGADRGYNYQASGSGRACVTNLTPGSYSTEWPKATYTGGERIRVLWPAKNHDAGSRCTNPFIPDTQMKLFRICGSARDALAPNFNPTVDQVLASELVVDWKQERRPVFASNGRGPRDEDWGPGFQNCPFFCDDTDKAVCFQEFDVPAVSASTECTYVWYWIFNNGDAPYLSCFDVTITPGGQAGNRPTTTAAPATTTAAPGTTTAAPGTTQGPRTTEAPRTTEEPRPTAARPQENCSPVWGQCGGQQWTGATCCQEGSSCVVSHQWYSQCLPGGAKRSVEESSSSSSLSAGVAGFFVGGVLAVACVAIVAVVVLRKRSTKTTLETELIVRS